jgi:hypothetical protein
VLVVDGRDELVDEVATCPDDVHEYLRSQVTALIADREFIDALPGMCERGRDPIVLERLQRIASGSIT